MKNDYMKVLDNTNLSNLPETTGGMEVKAFINGTPLELYNIECALKRIEDILKQIRDK